LSKKKLTPLWSLHNKFSEKNPSPTSYLFGTMHVQDARAFAFVQKAKQCLVNCDEFFTEIRFDGMVEESMIKAQQMPEGQSLRSLLGEKKFAKAEKMIAKAFHVPLSRMDGLLPMVVINHLVMQSLSVDQAEHLDMTLHQYARENEKTVRGLETVQEHISVLENIPLDMQKKQLMDLIKQPEKYKKKVVQLADTYARGDIYALYKSSKKSMGKLKGMMIYDRNHLMANRIAENIETSAFYAFGAAHLAGKQGILKLLKNKGLKVQPIVA